jgi:hypothetical protein
MHPNGQSIRICFQHVNDWQCRETGKLNHEANYPFNSRHCIGIFNPRWHSRNGPQPQDVSLNRAIKEYR